MKSVTKQFEKQIHSLLLYTSLLYLIVQSFISFRVSTCEVRPVNKNRGINKEKTHLRPLKRQKRKDIGDCDTEKLCKV